MTGNISSGVATLIESTSNTELEGKEVGPVLVFLQGKNELIACGGFIYT